MYTQAEIDLFNTDYTALQAWLATNPPDGTTMPVITTPYIDTNTGEVTYTEHHYITNEVVSELVSITGILVDLNTEMQVVV